MKWEFCDIYAASKSDTDDGAAVVVITRVVDGKAKNERWDIPGDTFLKRLIELLNELGAEGWEVVNVSRHSVNTETMSYFLKRQVI
jgi:hypothetical protein